MIVIPIYRDEPFVSKSFGFWRSNKFRRLPRDYFEGKNIAEMTHTHLYELVFIEMGLDWE